MTGIGTPALSNHELGRRGSECRAVQNDGREVFKEIEHFRVGIRRHVYLVGICTAASIILLDRLFPLS